MTHYKKLYRELWEDWKLMDSEGYFYVECVVCKCRIYEQNVTVNTFSHIKSKGSHPELKYDKGNVEPKCFEHHLTEHTKGVVHNYTGIK